MLLTDISYIDKDIQKAVTIELLADNFQCPKRELLDSYFLLTNTFYPYNDEYQSLTLTEVNSVKSALHTNQLTIIDLTKDLFASSKRLSGKELEILNKTYSRLFSKTPTKL